MNIRIGDYVRLVRGLAFYSMRFSPTGENFKGEIVKILEACTGDLHDYYLVEFQNVWEKRWIFFKRRK